MNISTKLLQAAAGQAVGAGLDVDEVFSTFLYEGTGSAQTITNNIDLSGEGGLVWTKTRSVGDNHRLTDTARGAGKGLDASNNYAEWTANPSAGIPSGVSSFNSNGFVSDLSHSFFNNEEVVNWTFRKAPRFFDIQTWTGNSASDRAISHNLDSVPGMIIVKRLNSSEDWGVWHRDVHANTTKVLYLNKTDALTTSSNIFGATNPTSTNFYVGDHPVSNNNSDTYVAYIFAHNNSDGGFGPDADQDVIKCGSYTGNGSSTGPVVNLGFEPQFIMIKRASGGTGDWDVYDNMRGIPMGAGEQRLEWNTSDAESTAGADRINLSSTGFSIATTNSNVNTNGDTYIYMAIRRGPLAEPTSATDVFAIDTSTSDSSGDVLASTFPVDMYLYGRRGGGSHGIMARLTETRLFTDSTSAEGSLGSYVDFDRQTGIKRNGLLGNASTVDYMWKRAPGYFDVITWKVDGTGDQTINHNLGVVPEMIWSKNRNDSGSGSGDWWVAHKDLTGWDSANENDRHTLKLNSSAASAQQGYHRDFTSTSIRLLSNAAGGYVTSHTGIAYLFATVAGVSKVGSYTGTGAQQNIDCGFSSGARFVLIKRSSGTGHWRLMDSERGIVSGVDKTLLLNTTNAEITDEDTIDPHSSGFSVPNNADVNASGSTYIFYAIA